MLRTVLLLLCATTALAGESRRYIVEFDAPPLAVHAAKAVDYEATFERFREDLARPAIAGKGGTVIRHRYFRALHGAAVETDDPQAIAQLPYVTRVTPDVEVTAFGDEASASAADVPRSTAGGTGVIVAVIDSGIDAGHPALAGKVVGGWDFVNDDSDPMDDHRHGTHVAGIIAAEGETTGIAPGVKLLAYKVLNAEGKGVSSNIIAAIERALDPNQDGNLADHAGVINVSLGGPGQPGDPLSLAVERAVAAGAVVCVAAGNDGLAHRIGSPAGTASAITVGASDAAWAIADFSTRGPATQSGAIKPDVLAPGVGIRSTVPGGAYMVLNGTSMATPYVAGLAALLRAEHPDWTPARIKSVLTTSAAPFAGTEAMAQGAGLVDRSRSLTAALTVEPTQVNFGLDGVRATAWNATRTITVRNDSGATLTVKPRFEGATIGITLQATPPEADVPAGQAKTFDLRVDVDNTTLGLPESDSLSFGGWVVFESAAQAARLPWAFLRAARATVSWQGAALGTSWSVEPDTYGSANLFAIDSLEVLMKPGTADLVAAGMRKDAPLRLAVREQQNIEGDARFAFSDADAPHEVTMRAFAGAESTDKTLYSPLGRLVGPNFSLPLQLGGLRSLFSSSFSDRYALLMTESLVDTGERTIHLAQHPAFRVGAGDVALDAASLGFLAQTIEIALPQSGGPRSIAIMPRDWPRNPLEHRPQPPSIEMEAPGDRWRATLYFTPEVHPDFASGVQLGVKTDPQPGVPAALMTPMIRRTADGRYISAQGFGLPEVPNGTLPGERLGLGDGPVYVPTEFVAAPEGLFGTIEIRGDRNETRRNEVDTLTWKAKNRTTGAIVASGEIDWGVSYLALPSAGPYEVELRTDATRIAGRTGSATVTLQFDTNAGTTQLPAMTSLAVLDPAGRHVSRLPLHGEGTAVVSFLRAASVSAFFRPLGKSTWIQLGVDQTGEDAIAGRIYRVDLADALNYEGGIEISFIARGVDGTYNVLNLAPGFIVEPGLSGKQRATR